MSLCNAVGLVAAEREVAAMVEAAMAKAIAAAVKAVKAVVMVVVMTAETAVGMAAAMGVATGVATVLDDASSEQRHSQTQLEQRSVPCNRQHFPNQPRT